ncbi:MAG: hypothetical protein H7259_05215 [Cytophagales bacterium]|nr:hypothetical protein [Cytophaga sp.]
MKTSFLSFLLSIVFASSACAQLEIPFPAIITKKMNNQSFPIPDSVKGKYTIIGIAYSRKAEKDLASWYEPAFQTFVQKKKTIFADDVYNVNIYFMAVITGVNKAVSDDAIKSIKAQTQKELLPYILTYTGEFASYKKTLKITENDTPYFFVLDEKGIIVHVTSGAYSLEKMKKIEEMVSEME